jgi:hypothetical protein
MEFTLNIPPIQTIVYKDKNGKIITPFPDGFKIKLPEEVIKRLKDEDKRR